MKASSESGLWATRISRVCAGEMVGSAGLIVALTAGLILSREKRLPGVDGEPDIEAGRSAVRRINRRFGTLAVAITSEPGNDGSSKDNL